MKWLDKKINAYQEKAFQTFAELQDVSPEQLQAVQQNIIQGAQGHYDPATAAALGNQETADFLALPPAEQRRQQQVLQEYGQKMRALWESGIDVQLTITSVEATGVVLCGQRQFSIGVQVEGAAEPFQALVVQVIPGPVFADYAVGAKFKGKVNPDDYAEVGIFEKLQ